MRTLLLFLACLSAACATTTKIVSEPPGATVTNTADKKELGKTPMTYESKMWIWESDHLVVAKNGKSKSVELKRNEADILPLVGGGCLTLTGCGAIAGIPIILAGGFKFPAEVKVDLEGGAPKTGDIDDGQSHDLVAMRY